MSRVFLLSLLLALSSQAAALDLTATSSGSYRDDGNLFSTTSYRIGRNGSNFFHAYLVFNVPSGPAEIGINLKVNAFTTNQFNVPIEIRVWSFDGSIATLGAGNSAANYTDLGAGTMYSSLTFTVAPANNSRLTFTLNAAGLAAVNALRTGGGGTIAFGLAFFPDGTGISGNQRIFDNSNATGAQLETVPEPSTCGLLALGLGVMAYRRRRQAKVSAPTC